MKVGSEDKKKLYAAGALGTAALGFVLYTALSGTSDTPATPPPVTAVQPVRGAAAATASARVSRTASDPSLHPEGMELTEQLLYTGSRRNIFSATAEPEEKVVIPKPIASARVQPVTTMPGDQGPPPLPPIDLKFFGTATRAGGERQAFFLKGDDVFLAKQGDVVSRRYKVGAVGANSVEVTDLTNNNTQRLPLAQQ